MSIETTYLQSAIKKFNDYRQLADKTFDQLSDADFLYQPNSASNSIAIIIQHMHGNMLSRWTNFLTEDGEKNWRKRDAEFEDMLQTKQGVLNAWNTGWACVLNALESLQPEDLIKTITIRSEPLVVVDAIIRQIDHYGYHVGQIVYIGKIIKDADWQTLSIAKKKSEEFNKSMHHSK
jgi:hypothetical protein